MGKVLIVIYNTIRYGCGIIMGYLFFPLVVRKLKKGFFQFIVVLAGILLTTQLMLSSVPIFRPIFSLFFGYNFLYPSAERTSEIFLGSENAGRGSSIIGSVNISGVFLLFLAGIVFHFVINKRLKPDNIKFLTFYGIVFCIGSLFTYSRSVLLTLVVITLLLVFKIRNIALSIFVVLVLLIGSLNYNVMLESDNLKIDRYTKTLDINREDKGANFEHGLNERFESYTEPFRDLFKMPILFFIGSTINTLKADGLLNFAVNKPDHSLFGRSFYIHGLLVTIFYMLLLIRIISVVFLEYSEKINYTFILLPIIFWCITAHGMISNPIGAFLFFSVLGLIENKSINARQLN